MIFLQLMCELGNSVINRVYEANREKMGAKKPQPGSQRYSAAQGVSFQFFTGPVPLRAAPFIPHKTGELEGSSETI